MLFHTQNGNFIRGLLKRLCYGSIVPSLFGLSSSVNSNMADTTPGSGFVKTKLLHHEAQSRFSL